MTIKTKYEVGDYVYFMHHNQAIRREILGIDTMTNSNRATFVKNWFSKETQVEEDKCFNTKEELLETL